jgi:hypothetical protein
MVQKMLMQIINKETYYKKISQFNKTTNDTKSQPSMNLNTKFSLGSSMIERVHKTKPGCSACGKKVY